MIWAGFLSRIGIEIIPRYGLEVDLYLRMRKFARKPFFIINTNFIKRIIKNGSDNPMTFWPQDSI